MATDNRLTLAEVRNRIVETRRMRLGDILPNSHNWRRHSDGQRGAFRGVAREIGWAGVPLAYHSERNAGKLTYIDGHMREEELPDLEADVAITDLSDSEADYLLATFDPISAMAEADREALGAILANVQSSDAAVQEMLSGLAEREGVLFGNGKEPEDPGAQIDKAGELQEKWQVRANDLWVIPSLSVPGGEHRVVCGDCTDRAVVERVMGGNLANVCFADPPYGVEIGAKNRFLNSFQRAGRNLENITNDTITRDELYLMLVSAFSGAREFMHDCAAIYVTAPQGGELGLMMMMMEAGLPIRHVLIWEKNAPTFSLGRLDYEYQHEPILYTWKKTHKHYANGPHKTSVWHIDKPRASPEHPTMKPVELVENAILNSSELRMILYDPFLGSGTTLVACEKTGRLGRGVEIEPRYVSVALERLSGLGLSPRRLD